MIAKCQSILTKIKVLLMVAENSLKTEIKLFLLCAISYENLKLVINSGNFLFIQTRPRPLEA